jgi:hypothetical protein
MGGPPGIPGNPLPAELNVPGLVELGIVPIPCTSEGEETGAAGTLPVPPAGSSPFCRLSDDGFCGFAGDGLVCASPEEIQIVKAIGRASRRIRIIEASLSCSDSLSVNKQTKNQPELVVREAGIEPARHC